MGIMQMIAQKKQEFQNRIIARQQTVHAVEMEQLHKAKMERARLQTNEKTRLELANEKKKIAELKSARTKAKFAPILNRFKQVQQARARSLKRKPKNQPTRSNAFELGSSTKKSNAFELGSSKRKGNNFGMGKSPFR